MHRSKHALRRGTRPYFRHVLRSYPRILRRSDLWGGKAAVAGTRVPVFMVHARLQSGWTPAEIREAYPRLTDEDVQAVVRYCHDFPARVMADRRAYERSLPADVAG
jgi:uncharacterized protein (DUF433 family)